jgi:hypothetical protein
MIDEIDREIEGAAGIYQRARKWGHLPDMMTFETFVTALRRGDDPYVEACDGADSGSAAIARTAARRAMRRSRCCVLESANSKCRG